MPSRLAWKPAIFCLNPHKTHPFKGSKSRDPHRCSKAALVLLSWNVPWSWLLQRIRLLDFPGFCGRFRVRQFSNITRTRNGSVLGLCTHFAQPECLAVQCLEPVKLYSVNMSTLYKQTNCWEWMPALKPKKQTNKTLMSTIPVPNVFSFGILIFWLLGSPYKISEPYDEPF